MYTHFCTILYTQTGICTHTFNLKYCTILYYAHMHIHVHVWRNKYPYDYFVVTNNHY